MKRVGIQDAKASLSRLIRKACLGEEIVIVHGKNSTVRLVPVRISKERRRLGMLKDKLAVGPEFFDPLPQDELAQWE